MREDDGNERVIVDSFDIACYLEGIFSSPQLSLFSPEGNKSLQNVEMGKSYARFVEHWVNIDFANVIRPALLAPVGRSSALVKLNCSLTFMYIYMPRVLPCFLRKALHTILQVGLASNQKSAQHG